MARKVSLVAIGILVTVIALLLVGQWSIRQRSQGLCGFCKRHIHAQAGIMAEVGGKRRHVCCAHCAITEGLQEHKPVRFIQVTDYRSGATLDPARASYVEGSRVVSCTHDTTRVNEVKHVDHAAFDRCSPGTFAFASRQDAEAFAAENGGAVRTLEEVLKPVSGGKAQP